ncbi:hypothetical protein [Cohnella yongneupensis]|uniref:Uncharacterized protein n=1 Tax=Cohnella yongneupensis TaxID=425006 RepID=A0ABW0QWA2_9BACL
MANIFVKMKQASGLLNAGKRFCRDAAELQLINEKVAALEEVFDFAKEFVAFANHQTFSNVGDRLYFYLGVGNLNYKKVADHFKVSPETVASNVSYASTSIKSLFGAPINLLMDAEDVETVRVALLEFRAIRKSVVNPLGIPEISEELLKSVSKRKKINVGGITNAKNKSQIIIPRV